MLNFSPKPTACIITGMADENLLRAISSEEAINVLREKILVEQAQIKSANARTKAINRATVAKEKHTKALQRHTANIEDVIQRYAHQSQQLELMVATSPELIATMFAIQEWFEELSEGIEARFATVERKLDMALKLQEFILAQSPPSRIKELMETDLRNTIVMETPVLPDKKVALKRRLVMLHNTLNKLLERDAKQGSLNSDISLEVAIEDVRVKISIAEEELSKLSQPGGGGGGVGG